MRVAIRIHADGTFQFYADDPADVTVLVIDENCPRDRVYEMQAESIEDGAALDRAIGASPVNTWFTLAVQ